MQGMFANGAQVCLVANLKHKNMKWLKSLLKKKQVEIAESKQLNIPAVSSSAIDKYYCKTDNLIIYTKTNTCRDWFWHYC